MLLRYSELLRCSRWLLLYCLVLVLLFHVCDKVFVCRYCIYSGVLGSLGIAMQFPVLKVVARVLLVVARMFQVIVTVSVGGCLGIPGHF